jgi:NAD(P)-dependent dehydrogenase (short-subunit alcohol dehydrogenase family)
MLAKGEGRLFFIGSSAGHAASMGTGSVAYALSKSLLFHLAALLNAMAGTKEVRAYVVVPGIIDTPQNRDAMPEADRSDWITPEKIASQLLDICEKPVAETETFILHC